METIIRDQTQLRPVTPQAHISFELSRALDLLNNIDLSSDLKEQLLTHLNKASRISAQMETYLSSVTQPPSECLRDLERATLALPWQGDSDLARTLEPEMLSGHLEGQFLKQLVRFTKATSLLEIGLFTGYSALAMAEGLPENGKLVACELDETIADFAESYLQQCAAGRKVDIRRGKADESLEQLRSEGQSFDLVFIDADKPGYRKYLDQLISQPNSLLADQGLIVVDNTLYQGEIYTKPLEEMSENAQAIYHFNEYVRTHPELEVVLLPIRDGVMFISRKQRS
ncbi:O-methyltransferase [Tunicatimonas pelagia]|uniref:O-methyltransferase n=1 Tax=Tunicatimonas pelagia TaxID=931531 RepID=UPI002666D027|nr:class I SAM-dependent methyltransferase [Tunicatimonas pelagia]WKN41859.1 class I SAM-dependent methyltransferase [Tunicatimonas pelagia]